MRVVEVLKDLQYELKPERDSTDFPMKEVKAHNGATRNHYMVKARQQVADAIAEYDNKRQLVSVLMYNEKHRESGTEGHAIVGCLILTREA